MATETKKGQCKNLSAVLQTKAFGSNEWHLSVTGTIKTGPENKAYSLKEIVPPGTNSSIVGLKISPDPTIGDIDHPIKYIKIYNGLPVLSSVTINDGADTCSIPIQKHID